MRILETRTLSGPNYWSIRRHKLIVLKLDLEELEDFPTNKIEGFFERLQSLLPSLYEHRCSEDKPGGFFDRVKSGTWMGHVIEHIALELQTLAGMETGFGRTRETKVGGVYNVVFSCLEKRAGLLAAERAVAIATALVEGKAYDLSKDIEMLAAIYSTDKLGPSTSAIVEAAVERKIPYIRLNGSSYVQLGYGAEQKRIQATLTEQTSVIAVEIAGDKDETNIILADANIPVPEWAVAHNEEELKEAINQLGYPLAIKPLSGNQGKGVSLGLRTFQEAVVGLNFAKKISETVVVERFIEGKDYRLLVVDYKFCAASCRIPAMIVGDGQSTVKALIDQVNQDPRRGKGHEKTLTKIEVDEATQKILNDKYLTFNSILPEGEVLYLKQTANLSTGGTAIDVTDEVHPEIIFMAERAARAVGLDICGIDLIAENITMPLKNSGAAVIEVNAAPGFRMHTHPSQGQPRNVGKNVVDMLFPDAKNGRIPLIAVTGTNGKTSTTRLLAHIIKQLGVTVGFTTTEGIYINDHLIEAGDCTGPISAEKVLKDPAVAYAVLECARGGMLRSGLAFDECDIGIVTNVAEDHLGLKDINTIEDMARLKAIVPESVKENGYAVLNADNDLTYGMREGLKCQIALFSLSANSERIIDHCMAGGLAAVYEEGFVVIIAGKNKIQIAHVEEIPLSFRGTASFMIENILAATLAAYAQLIPSKTIAEGLKTFIPSAQNTPGRMNLYYFKNFYVLIDYAHNPHGIAALGNFIAKTDTTWKVGIITGVGDRRDQDIINIGRVSAGIFDEIIIRSDKDTRGRPMAEIAGLITEGIEEVNPAIKINIIPDEFEALKYAIQHVKPGAIIVHLSDKVTASIAIIDQFKRMEEKADVRQVYQ